MHVFLSKSKSKRCSVAFYFQMGLLNLIHLIEASITCTWSSFCEITTINVLVGRREVVDIRATIALQPILDYLFCSFFARIYMHLSFFFLDVFFLDFVDFFFIFLVGVESSSLSSSSFSSSSSLPPSPSPLYFCRGG